MNDCSCFAYILLPEGKIIKPQNPRIPFSLVLQYEAWCKYVGGAYYETRTKNY